MFYILVSNHCGQAARVARIKEVCKKQYGSSPPPVNRAYTRILVDETNKVLYCVIPKTGCSTWKTLFVNLSGNATLVESGEKIQVHGDDINRYGIKYLNQYSRENREEILMDQSYMRFIVVRNPFDRLVSAFNDKINRTRFGYSNGYSGVIQYRKTTHDWGRGNFTKFAMFLTEENKPDHEEVDVHWAKYEDLCQPCSVHYDFILKLETVDTDLPQFLDIIKANRTFIDNLNVRNSQRKKTFTGRILSEFVKVPEKVVKELYDTYALDFEYFGYNFDFDSHQSVSETVNDSC